MKLRQLYYFLFAVIVMIAYFVIGLWLPNLSILQMISLLFVTLASAMLYFVPILLPKKDPDYRWMKVKCFLVCIVYWILVAIVSYLFSFQFAIHPSFYLLMHTLALAVVHFILFVCSLTPRKEEEDIT